MPVPLDSGGFPFATCQRCGGGSFWKPAGLKPEGEGWQCEACAPPPPGLRRHACAVPTVRPDFEAFAERAAIREFDGGETREEAERAAAGEQGFADPAGLFSALAEEWRQRLLLLLGSERLCRDGERHVQRALAFVDGGYIVPALSAGWQPLELLGADPVAPWPRLDRLGAAYFEGEPVRITSAAIAFARPTGAELILRRRPADDVVRFPWEGGVEP